MSQVSMQRIEMILLKSDIDNLLHYLGEQACFQIIFPDSIEQKKSAEYKQNGEETSKSFDEQAEVDIARMEDAQKKLEELGQVLGYVTPLHITSGTRLPDDAMIRLIDEKHATVMALETEIQKKTTSVAELEETIHEAKTITNLPITQDNLEQFSFITIKTGTIQPEKLVQLQEILGSRAIIVPLDDKGKIVAASSRKGRFALDTELERAGFIKQDLPRENKAVPAEAIAGLEKNLLLRMTELATLSSEKEKLAASFHESWERSILSVQLKRALLKVENRLEGTQWAYRLEGWVPADRTKDLIRYITTHFKNVAISLVNPEAIQNETAGAENIPVLFKQNAFTRAFQSIVLSYGTPLYGDIDPTPIVAFFFTVLFAIMFGDVGQGLVIFLTGVFLSRTKSTSLGKYKRFGPAFLAAGAGSMFMGLLVGSFFADDALLVPFEHMVTRVVFNRSVDRILDIMPQGNLAAMFRFFGFTLGVGVLINSTGLVINMINLAKRKEYGKALFSKTGLAGALVFWWVIGMAVRIIAGGKLGWVDIPGLGIPLLALFLAEPLQTLLPSPDGHHEKISLVDAVVGGLVEIIETISYYASNTMSFLRVAAFALAHAVLSFVVFTMAELIRTKAPGGSFIQIFVYIIGNMVIIGLEGLIVTIQVIRLQYYEFFSKFFTRSGKSFTPMSFEKID